MRISIEGGGYNSAAESLIEGGSVALLHHDALTSRLAGTAGMAGDDATSRDFAASYDETAAEAVAAFGDLVDSFGSLGLLAWWSLDNHERAEARSVLSGAGRGATRDREPVPARASEFTPPTSLGAGASTPPDFWDQIQEHLEGFTWPGADEGRVREAADAWSDAAERLRRLPPYVDSSRAGFRRQDSPEAPAALATLADLRDNCSDLAEVCDELSRTCRDYADRVATTRELISGLLKELAIEIGCIVGAAAIGSLASGGLAAASAAGAILLRIAAAGRRVLAWLQDLQRGARELCRQLVHVAARSRRARRVLMRFKRTNRIISDASPARTAATYQAYRDLLASQMAKPTATHKKLSKWIEELWRPGATVGNGSTAAAARDELLTGVLVKGKDHVQKAEGYVVRLRKFLKKAEDPREKISAQDRHTAEQILQDLINALEGR